MLAAQGYQESRLDQNARSHVGAIGIMQIMPATGKELGVGDITLAEPNVHAGAKYMDALMTVTSATPTSTNRTGRCSPSPSTTPARATSPSCARRPQARGLDPNQWFNNVEMVTARAHRQETRPYVRNIYKYYVAYRLLLDVQEAQEKARATVKPGG